MVKVMFRNHETGCLEILFITAIDSGVVFDDVYQTVHSLHMYDEDGMELVVPCADAADSDALVRSAFYDGKLDLSDREVILNCVEDMMH